MNKKTAVLSTLTLFIPVICGLVLWNKLPAQIGTHFDINGVPNGYSSKTVTVFLLPVLMFVIQFICFLAFNADKKVQLLSGKIKNIILWVCPVISIFVFFCIYSNALGHQMAMTTVFTLFLGIEFIIIGNYLPKCRQNNVIGIRVPWTLSDETTWNKTHRFAGWLSVICGFALLIDSLLDIWSFAVSIIILIACITISVVYSAVIYYTGRTK